MKKRISLVGRFLFGLALAAAITFGSAEAVRGSGEVKSDCTGCLQSSNPELFCAQCCNAAGSICLEPDGQCLCA